MNIFVTVLIGLAPLFALIIVGQLLARKATVLHISHVPMINGLVINITLPSLIFLALVKAPTISRASLLLPVLLICAEAVTIVGALAIGKLFKLPTSTLGMIIMVGAFGNTAFLGYPISRSLLPAMFPNAVLLDEFGMMVVMYLIAAFVVGKFGHPGTTSGSTRASIVKFLRGQLFLSIAAAMIVRYVPWPAFMYARPVAMCEGVVLTTLGYLAQGTTPLILLAVGASLHPKAALSHPQSIILPSILKLVVCPVLMFTFCHFAGLRGDFLRVGTLQAAMPTGVLASVLCNQGKMDGSAAVGTVFATTVLSAATVPVVMFLLR